MLLAFIEKVFVRVNIPRETNSVAGHLAKKASANMAGVNVLTNVVTDLYILLQSDCANGVFYCLNVT